MTASYIKVLVHFLTAPLSVQLLVNNAPGKAADNGPGIESLPPTWETLINFLAPGFRLAPLLLFQPLEG